MTTVRRELVATGRTAPMIPRSAFVHNPTLVRYFVTNWSSAAVS